jgi:hypothetical protein
MSDARSLAVAAAAVGVCPLASGVALRRFAGCAVTALATRSVTVMKESMRFIALLFRYFVMTLFRYFVMMLSI